MHASRRRAAAGSGASDSRAGRAAVRRAFSHARGPAGRRGTTILEALAASVLGCVAALAMVYALASGNAAIRGMRIERGGLFAAQQKMEKLLAKPPGDSSLSIGNHGPESVTLPYKTGQTSWVVAWQDDPLDGTGGGDSDPQDYKKLTVTVSWSDAIARSVSLVTYLYP